MQKSLFLFLKSVRPCNVGNGSFKIIGLESRVNIDWFINNITIRLQMFKSYWCLFVWNKFDMKINLFKFWS